MVAQKGDNHEFNQSTTQEKESEIISSMGSARAFNNSSLHLTVEKLNSKNYREWTHAIKLVIDINGKLEFLTGETQRPPLTDAAASWKWRSKNSFITSCIINSMKPTIDKMYMFPRRQRMCGMRYEKHTLMPRMLLKSSNLRCDSGK